MKWFLTNRDLRAEVRRLTAQLDEARERNRIQLIKRLVDRATIRRFASLVSEFVESGNPQAYAGMEALAKQYE